jgi:hypothetical protein
MKTKRSDLKIDDSDRIKQEPLDQVEDTKRKRSKLLKWFLNIIDTIVTVFS